MKTFETITKTIKERKFIARFCDRCGAEIPEPGQWDHRRFELEFATGSSFPEGGSEEGWGVEDVCDNCLIVLNEILVENGFTIKPIDRDW